MPEAGITKRALGASLKNLMNTKPFHKISVGEICAQCGMNRKSFYYHFQDKYDLLNWVFYSEFMQLLGPDEPDDLWRYLYRMCDYFSQNKTFYVKAFAIEGQNAFTDTFNETLESIMSAYLQQDIKDEAFRDFYCHFYGDAFRCAVVRWLKDPAPLDTESFVALFRRIVNGMVTHGTATEYINL